MCFGLVSKLTPLRQPWLLHAEGSVDPELMAREEIMSALGSRDETVEKRLWSQQGLSV